MTILKSPGVVSAPGVVAAPGLATPGVLVVAGGGPPPPVIEGEYLDTFTETGPGLVSMGAPHTANIDINLNGGTYQPSGGEPAGLADIDSAIDGLVPVALDGQAAGGYNSFQLTDDIELRVLGTAPSASMNSRAAMFLLAATGEQMQLLVGTAPGQITALAAAVAGGVVGLFGDGIVEAAGQRTALLTVKDGVVVLKMDARTPLYYNGDPIDGKVWQTIIGSIAATVAGWSNDTINARLPTQPVAGFGGSGDFQDLFSTPGDVRNGTPIVNGFGAPWQSSQGLPGVTNAPVVAAGLLTWGTNPVEVCDVALGGFGKAAEVQIPAVDFGAAEVAQGTILLNTLGFFGSGLALVYRTTGGGTTITFELIESQFGPANVLKTVVVAYVASASLKFAYDQSTGEIAYQLGAGTIEKIATTRDITIRHLTCQGITTGGAGGHNWDEVNVLQVPTIL